MLSCALFYICSLLAQALWLIIYLLKYLHWLFEATAAPGRITVVPQRASLWTFPIEKVRQLWELTIFNFVTSVESRMGQIWTNKLVWAGQETY
jgi:hypothetical protein